MRAGIFGTTNDRTEAAIAEGLRALGFAVEFQRPGVWGVDQARPYSVVVVRGYKEDGNASLTGSKTIGEFYRGEGATVLVHDLPAIRKPGYFALWNGGLNVLPESAGDSRLGMVDLKERREGGSKILLCGQTAGDQAHGMKRVELEIYFRQFAAELLAHFPEHSIVWRPHPQQEFEIYWCDSQDPLDVSIEDAIADPEVFAVATFNSTCGVAALEQGVPVICDGASFYADLTGAPIPSGRREFFQRLTHTQWTLGELSTPDPYLFNLPAEIAA